MNGKGSKPRPFSVKYDQYSENWDNIFNQKNVIVPLKTLDNGDQYIEIPEKMLKSLGWKEGDDIEWAELEDGKFKLKKKK
jgi:hypothetical protein